MNRQKCVENGDWKEEKAMLERYTRKEMGRIWTQENRFTKMLEVEKAVARAQSELGLIPVKASRAICKKAYFQMDKIIENEKKTRHDVMAFVQEVSFHVGGSAGSWLHWGFNFL